MHHKKIICHDIKLEIVQLEKFKLKKVKEEKEAIRKEKKLLKKDRQKAKKKEEKQKHALQNNNSLGFQIAAKELRTYLCDLCNHTAKAQDPLQSHIAEAEVRC